jgi:hypothetical protein
MIRAGKVLVGVCGVVNASTCSAVLEAVHSEANFHEGRLNTKAYHFDESGFNRELNLLVSALDEWNLLITKFFLENPDCVYTIGSADRQHRDWIYKWHQSRINSIKEGLLRGKIRDALGRLDSNAVYQDLLWEAEFFDAQGGHVLAYMSEGESEELKRRAAIRNIKDDEASIAYVVEKFLVPRVLSELDRIGVFDLQGEAKRTFLEFIHSLESVCGDKQLKVCIWAEETVRPVYFWLPWEERREYTF